MVVLRLDAYSRLTEGVESALDEAYRMAMIDKIRLSHEEVSAKFTKRVNG